MGRKTTSSSCICSSFESPISVSVGALRVLSSRRRITPSPRTVGSTAMRMSNRRLVLLARTEMRPSCGMRCSAMSSFASTLSRLITPAACSFGTRSTSWRIPSTRSRTTRRLPCGRKWTSLAPSFAAWRMTEFTSWIAWDSERPSAASRSTTPSWASSSSSVRPRPTGRARLRLLAARKPVELGVDVGGRLRRPGRSGTC